MKYMVLHQGQSLAALSVWKIRARTITFSNRYMETDGKGKISHIFWQSCFLLKQRAKTSFLSCQLLAETISPWLQSTQLSVNLILASCRILSNFFHCSVCSGFVHVQPYKLHTCTLQHNWHHSVLHFREALHQNEVRCKNLLKLAIFLFCVVLNPTTAHQFCLLRISSRDSYAHCNYAVPFTAIIK